MARSFVQLSMDERRAIARMHETKMSRAEIVVPKQTLVYVHSGSEELGRVYHATRFAKTAESQLYPSKPRGTLSHPPICTQASERASEKLLSRHLLKRN